MKINLIEYFEDTVAKFPNKLAVCDDDDCLTFGDLQSRALIIAQNILNTGNYHNQPVVVLLPKKTRAISSIFGILYSGNIYVPLDAQNPKSRITLILANLRPACIISETRLIKKFGLNTGKWRILNLDTIDNKKKCESLTGYHSCIDTDPAYIIHTSGSTGVPKGVVISHRSVIDYILWAVETFQISRKEVIGNQAPLVFDNSTLDIYLMAFTGASLHLIPETYFIFPAKLLKHIIEQKINFIFWVPSVLINIANLNLLDSLELPKLKKILFAGEVMPARQLNYWRNRMCKDVLFSNLYGPTEITVDCTYFIVNRDIDGNEALPIGKPCRNSDILILDNSDVPCDIFEHGELCVRGSSLALGYWNDPEKTESVFVQNPLNSSYPEKIYRTGDIVYKNEHDEIIFVGRIDQQIKHHGYRIELGEIEHAISIIFENILPVVLYDHELKKIVLVYKSSEEISPVEFRKALSVTLLKYMIPTDYIRTSKIPYTLNGKIDRKLLNEKYMDICAV